MFEPLAAARADQSARFVKLDQAGLALPADATDHIVVRDAATQLEWAVAHACEGEVDFETAEKACSGCKAGGHGDWRLPTRFELESIVDLTKHSPAIDTEVFPGTESDWYWSSSPYAAYPDYAWFVSFNNGGTYWNHRDFNDAFVRAVRSVPASQ